MKRAGQHTNFLSTLTAIGLWSLTATLVGMLFERQIDSMRKRTLAAKTVLIKMTDSQHFILQRQFDVAVGPITTAVSLVYYTGDPYAITLQVAHTDIM